MWCCAQVGTWDVSSFYALPDHIQDLWLEFASEHMANPVDVPKPKPSKGKRIDGDSLNTWSAMARAARAAGWAFPDLQQWADMGCPTEVPRGWAD